MAAPDDRLSQKTQALLGLPPGFKVYGPQNFGGLSQAASRMGIADNDFHWIENFVKVGDGNLRCVRDYGATLYSAVNERTIINFFFYNIAATQYVAVFLSDGTAIQVNTVTGATVPISLTPFTFYNGGRLPACVQWGTEFLIICNNITLNSYWIWDGTTLYQAGTLGPLPVITDSGTSYTSSPAITIYGGSGSGIVLSASIQNGTVNQINVVNPGQGYIVGDQVQVAFSGGGSDTSAILQATIANGTVTGINIIRGGTGYNIAPTLTILGGGGINATATCTVAGGAINGVTVTAAGSGYAYVPAVVVETGVNQAASATITLMPYGVSGTSIEAYQNRLWLTFPYQTLTTQTGGFYNGDVFLVSAPESVTDFATSDGGLVFTTTESELRQNYVAVKQTNGYLYTFGDSSVSVVSGVQTAGNPPTTTFNYQNTDPQIGTAWRDSLQDYGRAIIFANSLGIFGLYGGGVSKLSDKIDNIFINAVFPPFPGTVTTPGIVTPSSAVATFYKHRHYLLLMTILDPFTQTTRNAMVAWDGKEFYILSQSTNIIQIATQEINSVMVAWATDGKSLFPLFQDATSTALTKILSSKLYGADSIYITKEAMAVYISAQDLSGVGSEVNSNAATDLSGLNAGIDFSTFTIDNNAGSYQLPNTINITSPYPQYQLYASGAGSVPGVVLGMTLTTTSPNFSINYLGIGYIPIRGVFGSDVMVSDVSE